MALTRALFIILLITSTTLHLGNCRFISNNSDPTLSDGINDQNNGESTKQIGLQVNALEATTVTCEPIYGFLPCTTTFWGLLFMIIVYEILLSFGEQYLSSGSDLFFETFGTGIFGASIFHMLGTFPQVALILVTGITASSDSIREQARISMGLLAGKTIMSLTLIWGSVVAFGSRDLSLPPTSTPSDLEQDPTTPFSLTGYGVTSDVETSRTARIMLISLIPFLILQLAKIVKSSSGIQVVVLVALIVTLGLLIVYFIYQIFQPWIQNRRLEFVMRKYIRRNLLENLLTAGRRPNVPVIRELFHKIDQNGNSYISTSELRALVIGLQIEVSGLHQHDFVSKIMAQFDISQDHQINEQEFVTGLSNWLIIARDTVPHVDRLISRRDSPQTKTEEQQSLIAQDAKIQAAAADDNNNDWLNYIRAGLLIILGTTIMLVLGQPLVSTLVQFSFAANIPSFLISYVVIPLALNFGQALSSISSAKQKTEAAISVTLSEIYNRIFMNNMMGLVAFLALVYIRNVAWDVSAEVLVVLIMCTVMGLYASFNTTFPVWTSIVAIVLYPISLLFLYLLTSVLGWT